MAKYKQGGRDDGKAKIRCLTPCVCKTPMGNSTPPVPYIITAYMGDDMRVAKKCRFNGKKVFTMDSRTTKCKRNKAGKAGGIKSGVNTGHCRPKTHTKMLRVESAYVIRDGDLFEMNCAGPDGASNTIGKVYFESTQKEREEFSIPLHAYGIKEEEKEK